MRWLFLLVLLLNGIYLLTQLGSSDMDLYEDVPRLRNVEPIVLLREIDNGENEVLKEELDDSVASVASTSTSNSQSDVAQLEDISKTSVTEAGQCFTLGPFGQKNSLQALKDEVAPYVVSAVIRGKQGEGYTVHWVYIQPEKSRKDIRKVAKRLKTKKIKDFYIIREGEKYNGISLGHFKDKKRAFGLKAKVKKYGFDVHIEPIHRTSEVFWLEYELIDQALPKDLIGKYTQSVDVVVSRISRDCHR
jgi:hypothetical protein